MIELLLILLTLAFDLLVVVGLLGLCVLVLLLLLLLAGEDDEEEEEAMERRDELFFSFFSFLFTSGSLAGCVDSDVSSEEWWCWCWCCCWWWWRWWWDDDDGESISVWEGLRPVFKRILFLLPTDNSCWRWWWWWWWASKNKLIVDWFSNSFKSRLFLALALPPLSRTADDWANASAEFSSGIVSMITCGSLVSVFESLRSLFSYELNELDADKFLNTLFIDDILFWERN